MPVATPAACDAASDPAPGSSPGETELGGCTAPACACAGPGAWAATTDPALGDAFALHHV